MSTKIYNGLKIEETNFSVIKSLCLDYKQYVSPIIEKTVANMFWREIFYHYDRHTVLKTDSRITECSICKPENKIDSEFLGSFRFFQIRKIEDTFTKRFEGGLYNTEITVVFFPLEKYTLAIPFDQTEVSPKDIKPFVEFDPRIKFYGYWDNTDQDENSSEEEWQQRENDWNEVLLSGNGVPLTNGFSFTILQDKEFIYSLYSPNSISNNEWKNITLKERAMGLTAAYPDEFLLLEEDCKKVKEHIEKKEYYSMLSLYDKPESKELRITLANELITKLDNFTDVKQIYKHSHD